MRIVSFNLRDSETLKSLLSIILVLYIALVKVKRRILYKFNIYLVSLSISLYICFK